MLADVYRHPRVRCLLGLGAVSGLPLALSSSTLQAWLTVAGLDVKVIAWFSMLGVPYTLKFLWAPVLDRFARAQGGRWRWWLMGCQGALGTLLLLMALLEPQSGLVALAVLAFAVAFSSATLDIAIDAYRAETLLEAQRGAGAAVSVLGYRLGMLVSGGMALWLADQWLGFRGVYALLGVLCWLTVPWLRRLPAELTAPQPPSSLAQAVWLPLREFFTRSWGARSSLSAPVVGQRRSWSAVAWAVLALVILYKLGDAFAGSLSMTFLIRGAGYAPGDVGWTYKVLGLIATLAGGVLGGGVMARLPLFRALLVFGVLQMLSNLGFVLLALDAQGQGWGALNGLWATLTTATSTPPQTPAFWKLALVVITENLCGGMGTTAFVALLMSLVNAQYSATQFALLSSLGALGRVLIGPSAGYAVAAWGWAGFFVLSTAMALPGLLLLVLLRPYFAPPSTDQAGPPA